MSDWEKKRKKYIKHMKNNHENLIKSINKYGTKKDLEFIDNKYLYMRPKSSYKWSKFVSSLLTPEVINDFYYLTLINNDWIDNWPKEIYKPEQLKTIKNKIWRNFRGQSYWGTIEFSVIKRNNQFKLFPHFHGLMLDKKSINRNNWQKRGAVFKKANKEDIFHMVYYSNKIPTHFYHGKRTSQRTRMTLNNQYTLFKYLGSLSWFDLMVCSSDISNTIKKRVKEVDNVE